MIRIALASLFHDKGKLLAALAGVAFAATLTVTQGSLYAGFLYTASALITRLGGDVWVMSQGTKVIDSVEKLAEGTRPFVASHPCVERVRPLVSSWSFFRKPVGGLEAIRIVGLELGEEPFVPWELAEGLPADLQGPMRVAVDEQDLEKLELGPHPVGQRVTIWGQNAFIAAVTRGARPFTLIPYVFADVGTARRLGMVADEQVNYWVVDLKDRSCTEDFMAFVGTDSELQAQPTAAFAEQSQRYWVRGSGAGSILAFTALLGLIVGAVVVGQTLYTITKEHQRELATLKALGSSARELVGFVLWQGAFLGTVGITVGFGIAFLIGFVGQRFGLVFVFSPAVLLSALGVLAVMCVVACGMSVRRIVTIDAGEVFQ